MNGFFGQIIKSFNPKFFKEIAFQTLGKSLKYFITLLLLLALVLSIKYSITFARIIHEAKEALPTIFERLKEIPEITIKNGELTSPKEFYSTRWEGGGLIIDPFGSPAYYLESPPGKGYIIILKDKLIFQESDMESRTYDLSQLKYFNLKFNEGEKFLTLAANGWQFDLTPEKVKNWANKLILILFPVIFIFVFLFLWIGKLIQVFIFSLFSLILNKVKKTGLNYSSLLNIGIFALTVPLILETLIKLSGIKVPHFGFFYYGLYLVFLTRGILGSREIKPISVK